MLSLLKTIPNNRKYLALTFVCLAVFLVLVLSMATKAQAMEPIQNVLKPGSGVMYAKVASVWNSFLTLVNSIMVVLLLVVAFANILHIQLDSYGIKKILPSLIISIILANFSYFICRFIIDIANMLLVAVINGVDPKLDPTVASKAGGPDAAQAGITKLTDIIKLPLVKIPKPGTNFWSEAWAALGIELGRIVMAVFVAILSYLFFIRNWILYFLVALSPLGFIAMAIPQGKTVFQAWWKNFIQWTFMPVVSAFWLWVGAVFLASNLAGGAGKTVLFVFAMACFYFAITTPFKMGGAIMQGWGNLGKKAWSSTGGAAGKFAKSRWVDPFIDHQVKNRLKNWYGDRVLGGVVMKDGKPLQKPVLGKDGKQMTDDENNPLFETVRKRRKLVDRALGWHFDRAKTFTIDRADRAKRWENIQNQMQGNTMNYWSHDKQHRRSKYIDESNSFLGEIERTELDQRAKFLSTPEGLYALQRTYLYQKHMEGLNSEIKNRTTTLDSMWANKDKNFMLNPDGTMRRSGNSYWSAEHVWDKYQLPAESSQAIDLASRKTVNEMLGAHQDVAAKADFISQLIHTYTDEVQKIQNSDLHEDEKQRRIRLLDQERNSTLDDLKSLMEAHFDETKGVVSPLLRKMVGKVATYDNRGKITLDMSKEALATFKTQGELAGYGYESKERKMVSDRAGKILTIHMNEELKTEREKRQGPDSGVNIQGKLGLQEALQLYDADMNLRGGTWMTRDALARRENVVMSATNYQDPRTAQSKVMLAELNDLGKPGSVQTDEHGRATEIGYAAAQGIVARRVGVIQSVYGSQVKSSLFTNKLNDIFSKAAAAQPVIIGGAAREIKTENDYLQALKDAEAAGDTAATGVLDTIRVQADKDIIASLHTTFKVEPEAIGNNLALTPVRDDYGHVSDIAVEAQGDVHDPETRTQLQESFSHVETQFASVNPRDSVGTAIAGAIRRHHTGFGDQYHSKVEKEVKGKATRMQNITERGDPTVNAQT